MQVHIIYSRRKSWESCFGVVGLFLDQIEQDLVLLFAVRRARKSTQSLCIVCFWDGHLIVQAGLRSLIFLCLCVPPSPPPVLATPCYVIPVIEPRPPCILGKHSTYWAPVQYTILKSTYTCLEHFISLFWLSCWPGLWRGPSLVQEWLSSAHNFVCKQGLITLEVGDCYSELTCLRHNSSTLLILG